LKPTSALTWYRLARAREAAPDVEAAIDACWRAVQLAETQSSVHRQAERMLSDLLRKPRSGSS
jgi:hypothetical protein